MLYKLFVKKKILFLEKSIKAKNENKNVKIYADERSWVVAYGLGVQLLPWQ